MKKRHVAVLMGGVSSEHDVSLKSGAMVIGSMDRRRYNVTPVTITKAGAWKFVGAHAAPLDEALPQLKALRVDCVFIALHGAFGEDGRLQGMLDMLGIPYTGSGCAASALALDKIRAKAVVAHAGVPVASQCVLRRADWEAAPGRCLQQAGDSPGFPCVLKSPCQGSSIGMAIVQTPDEFRSVLPDILNYDDTVLVEEFLRGPELTCGVLDTDPGKPPRPLPVTAIRPLTAAYFDYVAKYTPGATEEITPAPIPPEATREVQEQAVRVHEAIGCRGLSRSDMILTDRGPVWIEVNTLPGMTETSLFPQGAAAAGIAFPELVARLIDASLAASVPSPSGAEHGY